MGVILTLPRLGETMEEARVTDWLVAPGAAFRRGEVLLEVETDKTVVEVPAMQDGRLIAQLVAPGDMVALDAPIAEVEVEGGAADSPAVAAAEAATLPAGAGRSGDVVFPRRESNDLLTFVNPTGRVAASPVARRLARAAGMDLADITGTGRRGRVTGEDVRRAGTRATVVLLHGLHDHAGGWRDLPGRLASLGHPVAVPDLPGHGADAAEVADVTAAVEALLPRLPEGRLRIVGHSLGAVLAVRLAVRLGARVEALVLIAPAGLGVRINGDFLDAMAGAETPEALARGLEMLGAGPVSGPALVQELARIRQQRGRTAALAASVATGGVQQVDIAPDLGRLGVPVTAVFGLVDRIVGWQDCARLPATVAIHLVPGAGHLPHLHAPALAARLITGHPVHGGAPQNSA
ncbi:MAG: alpha/beta fold hydrolase [Gemmobacter sp.]